MKSRTLKSLDRYCELYKTLFHDLIMHHPSLSKNLRRDLATAEKRISEEGIGFLTCALPTLSKALLKGLETGKFEAPYGFKLAKGTTLPRFLGGLLTQVFGTDGVLLSKPCIIAINDVVQVTQFFYKIDLPYAEAKNQSVIDKFVEVEGELAKLSLSDEDGLLDDAAKIVSEIFKGFDPMNIDPCHGPGAVATGEKDEKKWTFTRKYKALHRVYPYYSYFVASRGTLLSTISSYRGLKDLEAGTAKVVLVPKDSRGPRLISMEPLEYQFVQQGLRKSLYTHIERKSKITRGYVNFERQEINRKLARWNSVTRRYATLDMAEASDRVSLALVRRLFRDCPTLLRSLEATRTVSTELPDGRNLPLAKFAPMGSALCFPIEAITFFVLAKAIAKREGYSGKIYVYGDDLIVESGLAATLFKEFPAYGLKFNENKSFVKGYFRESCGMDCYKGEQVTPVRMKKVLPNRWNDGELIDAASDLSNRLWLKGFWQTATWLDAYLKRYIRCSGVQPIHGNLTCIAKSFTSKCLTGVKWRWDVDYQRHLALLPKLTIKTRKSGLMRQFHCCETMGAARLLMNLSRQQQKFYLVPQAKSIKLGWSVV